MLGIGPAGLGAFPQAAQQGGVWGWGCLRRARPWPGGGARRQGNVLVPVVGRFGKGVDVRLRSLRRGAAGRCREAVLQRFRCSAHHGWRSSVAVTGLEQGLVMVLGAGAS